MKSKIIIISLLSMLALSACGGKGIKSEQTSNGESQSLDSSSVEEQNLNAPILKLNETKTGLVWDAVEGALGYEVSVNESEPFSATEYLFSESVNSYSVRVRSVSGNLISEYSTPYVYETISTRVNGLKYNNGVISWDSFEGIKLEYSNPEDESNYIEVVGQSVTITNPGVYSFRATAGYDEQAHKNYVGAKAQSVVATFAAQNPYVLEDGTEEDNATLQDEYTFLKFDGGWNESSSSVSLSSLNEGFSPNNCVQYNYWRHGAYFSFEKDINLEGSYDTLSFFLKGDGFSKVTLVFQIKERATLSGIDLTGTYISYTIDVAEACWKHYSINMNDENWTIDYGGAKKSVRDVLNNLAEGGISVSSITDLLPKFTSFQVRTFANPDENWSTTKIWMDEIILSNTGEQSKVNTLVSLSKYYAISTDTGASGSLTIGDTNVLTIDYNELHISKEVEVSKNGNGEILVKCTDETYAFEYVGRTNDSGYTFECVTCTGAMADYLAGMKLTTADVYTVDNFDAYESTGVGYDQNHAASARTGLRTNYYSDYYNGGSGSPLGGNGWCLMGSSDYLNLSDENHTPNGAHSAKLKYNASCAMRYISYGLYDGTAKAIGKGTTFSFWAKGTSHDIYLKARVYWVNKVTPSNQQLDSSLNASICIPANSDWTEYTVTLDASKTYYGFSLTTIAKNDSNAYFCIDDVSIYGSVSPWSK